MSRFLVSGVSRGIGAAVAQQLFDAGHEVWGVARPGSAAPGSALARVGSAVARVVSVDLADPLQLASTVSDQLPASLDGVVHAAGIVRPGSLSADAVVQDMADQLSVNVLAVAELTRVLLPLLRLSGGTVVLVNSGSGQNARFPMGAYGASKFALRAYADALRAEEPRVRVTTVYPGRTATQMQRTVRAAEGGAFVEEDYLLPSTVASVICSALLMPGDGVLTEVTVRPRTERVVSPDTIESPRG